jgi:BirA family biotin operon repressor/biotin-[acetyl-CoA-carboxylase] ligase
MNEDQLRKKFSSLPLGDLRYFDTIGSTNDEALNWASQGAPDLSLVISDQQTAGRGRSGRKWHTPPASALAYSLILRPSTAELKYPARITGLGALALADSLQSLGLMPQIKWPNDVLINGRKIAGILVESDWIGNNLNASILGMGVNVLIASTPSLEEDAFPPTCVEAELGHPLDRFDLLVKILTSIITRRNMVGRDEFIQDWESYLAYRGRQVWVTREHHPPLTGKLTGLDINGKLQVRTKDGEMHELPFGEITLRPAL